MELFRLIKHICQILMTLFSLSLFLLCLCPTNEIAAAAVAAAAMLGATGGQVQPMAVNIGALGGGAGGPQMMATPFGMIGTAPRFR